MESEKGSLNRIKILYAIMFLFTGAFVFGMSLILGKSHEAILRNTIVSLVGAGTIIFMLMDGQSVMFVLQIQIRILDLFC